MLQCQSNCAPSDAKNYASCTMNLTKSQNLSKIFTAHETISIPSKTDIISRLQRHALRHSWNSQRVWREPHLCARPSLCFISTTQRLTFLQVCRLQHLAWPLRPPGASCATNCSSTPQACINLLIDHNLLNLFQTLQCLCVPMERFQRVAATQVGE